METAKVDMRRLQLLNDRIAQVMDALNQVRFSVHGLQHAPFNTPWQQQQMGGYGVPQMGVPSPWGNPQGFNPIGAQGFNPIGAQGFSPIGAPGFTPGVGLGHTGFEAIDPYAAQRFGLDPYFSRINQTFPYAYSTVSPVGLGQ